MLTEQQKMVALLKMGKPLMKDTMVGASPASSLHDGEPSDDYIAELIEQQKKKQKQKQKPKQRPLVIYLYISYLVHVLLMI